MSEIESTQTESSTGTATENQVAEPTKEDISYHAVEKDGVVTAIWEMQGRKHVRTIDPRSRQGQDILRLYTTEHHDETPIPEAREAATS
jgi:hypothetical protein